LEWDKPQTGKYARESAPHFFDDQPAPVESEVREPVMAS
jgi:hypothetical protein